MKELLTELLSKEHYKDLFNCTVWYIDHGMIIEGYIQELSISRGHRYVIVNSKRSHTPRFVTVDLFGKSLFFSKEEAEQARTNK